ncbi:MAG TPA: hypothetical protein PLL64_02950 [Rhodothermales bacterium]|nr:hypothetical protein [Cytophagales bacterium]HRK73207.1 hypothetical protein [Rhodothermales bacterium]HRR08382.1 hypothetical protein [Rhodothermales bacterium]
MKNRNSDPEVIKQLVKEALTELIEEKRDIFNALFCEAVEQYFDSSHQQLADISQFSLPEFYPSVVGQA